MYKGICNMYSCVQCISLSYNILQLLNVLVVFRQILEVIAGVKEMDKAQLAQQVFSNTCKLFRW